MSAIVSARQAMLCGTFALSFWNFLSRLVCSWSHLQVICRVRAIAVIGCACTAHLDALLVTTPTLLDSEADGSSIFFSRYRTP